MIATQNYQKLYDLPSCDFNLPATLNEQGALYGKITQVCLRTPTRRALQTGGFTDEYSWISSYSRGEQGWALPLAAEYKQKPPYDSMLEALQTPSAARFGDPPFDRPSDLSYT